MKIVKPVGLKGNEVIDRMKSLMNISSLNENKGNSVVELTKQGPDGKIYGIVRENHEYYIKITDSNTNLVSESFSYIGGLKNKKKEAYSSYAKALKQLNLKFISINESNNTKNNINVFVDDDLLNEHHDSNPNKKLSSENGIGDNSEYIVNKKGDKLSYENEEDTETSGDNLAKGKNDFKTVKLSENEESIDEMLSDDETIDETELAEKPKKFSIENTLEEMDSVIDSITNNDDSLSEALKNLSESEVKQFLELIKKKTSN